MDIETAWYTFLGSLLLLIASIPSISLIKEYEETQSFIKAGYSQVVVAGKTEPIWIKGDQDR